MAKGTLAWAANRVLGAVSGLRGHGDVVLVDDAARAATEPLDLAYTTIEGEPARLSDLRGKVVLLVNTASNCVYTPQYEGLEALYQDRGPRGLVVLGFPCDDFNHQEPGSEAEIAESCKIRFGVTFPLSEKVRVLGADKLPLFRALTEEGPVVLRGEIKWNFGKFLLDRQGRPVGRFDPGILPESAALLSAVDAELAR